MILKELKDYLLSLSEEYDNYSVVNGEYGIIDEQYSYRKDMPITTIVTDIETKEILLLNDTDDVKQD